MKRVNSIICVTISILLVFLLNSCRTFDGYHYNLDDVRNEIKCYENTDYLFTVELDEVIIDFVINEHILHIVEIDCKDLNSKLKYQIKNDSSFSIEENIYIFNQTLKYDWTNSSKLSLKEYSWCIVSEEFNRNKDNLTSFRFVYGGIPYCLCYQISA